MSPSWGFPTGVATKPSGVIQGASSSSSGQVALSKSLAWWVTAGKKMGTAKGQILRNLADYWMFDHSHTHLLTIGIPIFRLK